MQNKHLKLVGTDGLWRSFFSCHGFFGLFVTKGAVIYIREKEEDDALEQARQNKEQEHAKQMEKMKRERMREAERRRREAVSEQITCSQGTPNFLTQSLSNLQNQNILSIVF